MLRCGECGQRYEPASEWDTCTIPTCVGEIVTFVDPIAIDRPALKQIWEDLADIQRFFVALDTLDAMREGKTRAASRLTLISTQLGETLRTHTAKPR